MPGKIVHFEIPTKDATRAKKFYGTLFGWRFKDSAMPGIEYYLTEGTEPPGALNPIQDGEKGLVIYFDTDDIAASISKVRELGGKADDSQAIPGDCGNQLIHQEVDVGSPILPIFARNDVRAEKGGNQPDGLRFGKTPIYPEQLELALGIEPVAALALHGTDAKGSHVT